MSKDLLKYLEIFLIIKDIYNNKNNRDIDIKWINNNRHQYSDDVLHIYYDSFKHKKSKYCDVKECQYCKNKFSKYNKSEIEFYRFMVGIITRKFIEFCEHPNKRNIVTFDCVGNDIKHYIINHNEYNNDEISFKNIENIFNNVTEIIFENNYIFNNKNCDNFLKWISNKKNKSNLSRLKFVYYDYNNQYWNENKLSNLYINKLNNAGWKYTPSTPIKSVDIYTDSMKIIGYQVQILKDDNQQ
mmetsp:Transcript_79033/g.96635  ORF Transcript_79033/g.96635 Transcript_79033/m.96635 type:complete len:242 (-) Transcript_79033:138-863(-)